MHVEECVGSGAGALRMVVLIAVGMLVDTVGWMLLLRG